ncbi:MAG: hypothetical protein ABFS16_15630 [Bacteroidota bacterium]
MTRLPVSARRVRILLLLSILFATGSTVLAQPECRSTLGAYFKPISENVPVSWAAELIAAPGVMSDRFIFNGMVFLGIDYNSKSLKHQIYFEGARKNWYNSADGPGLNGEGTGFDDFSKPEKQHFGFRELFYSYTGLLDVRTGIQTMKSGGSALLDERVLGVNLKKEFNSFALHINGGTVYDDIARMQDICGTRHLYNLARGNKVSFTGEKLFETNFAMAELSWSPGKKAVAKAGSGDEFEEFEMDDEFGAFESDNEFSEFSSEEEKKKFIQLNNAGIRVYEEFGPLYPDYKYYGGAGMELLINESVELQTELLSQWMNENNALIYSVEVKKEKFWNNGAFSAIQAEYFGLYELDEDIKHFPSFSNLFKGEIMRLDMMHLPLLEVSAMHQFPGKMKSGVEFSYIHQFKDAKTRELDAIYSIRPWKNIHLYAIGGYVRSELITDDNFLLRMEAHFAF